MPCTLPSTITGAELLRLLIGKTSLGRVGTVEIDNDIALNGTESQWAIAKADIESWADSCSLDMSAMEAGDANCQALNLSLKWYAIYRYRDFDIRVLKKKEDCTEDDYRDLAVYKKRVCEALKRTDKGSCMVSKFLASLDSEATECGDETDWCSLFKPTLNTDPGCVNTDFSDYVMTADDSGTSCSCAD